MVLKDQLAGIGPGELDAVPLQHINVLTAYAVQTADQE
jgi:hypothetical protein